MIYELPPLPYGINDLAPVISQETIEYHYGKHEQTYIDNLNKLIEGTPFADKPLEEIIKEADGALFNNASQASVSYTHLDVYKRQILHLVIKSIRLSLIS